ncbi:FAD-dependent oxidoreductase [Azohydromonas sp.]|uniref:NAD(P)/FAD-dependent oxidoreductase n=1 Tax=Azohydromonas sp. TaxID=1872666 RepID=UPI002BB8474D|nr:FAD-dependent oxidoreductase [Azohydromonas sp.]HMM85822.1 FAD-dependent oxidoreductase [Azohydromonas sp.]
MKHVILGAGPAGVIAAETIRKHAPADEILVVGDEPEAPYSRMAIPYLLIGQIDEAGTHLRHGPDHYAKLRIDVKRGVRAKAVDTTARTIALDDGSSVPFDRLLIATGSRPASPPIPGIHTDGVLTCWTLKDARAIAQRAQKGARVLQMGAGFIGCIIMEALAARGVQLTVVEMGDRMVPRMMGPTAGGMIKDWCEAKGVRVFTGTRVEAIEAHAPLRARLSDGQWLECDLVISATGVKPAIGFLEHSEVKCLQGVLTDEHMQTTVPGIYAAGDCAEAFDKISGKTIVSAIQPNAADQARVAALNMVGRRAELMGVTQINVLDTLGLISASFGHWEGVPGGEQVELTDRAAWRHLSLQFAGDRLVGCNSIGWTEHVGVMRGLVEGQVSLGEWKDRLLADPTLLMEAYLARAQAQHARGLVKA